MKSNMNVYKGGIFHNIYIYIYTPRQLVVVIRKVFRIEETKTYLKSV